MHPAYGWKPVQGLSCHGDICPQHPPTCPALRGVRLLIRFGYWCLLLCFAQALLTPIPEANAASLQESPQDIPSNAIVGGPFPVRSLSPIQLLYFQFTPERAVPVLRGQWTVRFDLVEANILARDQHQDDSFLFDFELTRANLALHYALFDR